MATTRPTRKPPRTRKPPARKKSAPRKGTKRRRVRAPEPFPRSPLSLWTVVALCLVIYPPLGLRPLLVQALGSARDAYLPNAASWSWWQTTAGHLALEIAWSFVPLTLVWVWLRQRSVDGFGVPVVVPRRLLGDLAGVLGLYALLRVAPFVALYQYQLGQLSPPDTPWGAPINGFTPLGPIAAGMMTGLGWGDRLLLIGYVPLQVCFEELVFRGLLYGGLRARWGVGPALGITALLFMLAHDPPGMPAALIWGLAFTALYEARRSLLAPILLHMANNLTTVLLAAVYDR